MSVEDVLSNPLVLQAAWCKVKNWYRTTELKPEPEFSHWQVYSEDELRKLGHELASGQYSPAPFPLVPFPKKGGIVRHYTMPSVKDQVAFAVFSLLLAPICEMQMSSVSFGNRWYRGVFKDIDEDGETSKWLKRPFALSDLNFYEPYRRSHGLFRRVAHWTAQALLDVKGGSFNDSESGSMAEFPLESLPRFVEHSWWKGPSNRGRGYWLQGDLQLAYPSVRIDLLVSRLQELVNFEIGGEERGFQFEGAILSTEGIQSKLFDLFRGFPASISQDLISDISIRNEIAARFGQALGKISYSEFDDAWVPAHATQQLPVAGTERVGLPTGLAVSGFLMNVYLNKVDKGISEWMEQKRTTGLCGRAAYLRFSDDFIIISDDVDTLCEGVDVFWRKLADDDEAVLSKSAHRNKVNLRINWTKIRSNAWSDAMKQYLRHCGWVECGDCGELVESADGRSLSFSTWWRDLTRDAKTTLQSSFDKDAFTALQLGPFVTYLVERLSDIGNDSLLNRFGQLSWDRLRELHSMVRVTLDDGQIREDTRLSFAINKLADTWLPDESAEAGAALIDEVRRSATECLVRAPWKFQMWRAIIRCAVRRPPGLKVGDVHTWSRQEQKAQAWLSDMLSFISISSESSQTWSRTWPENIVDQKCRTNGNWVEGYTSFLRSSFWLALADVIRDLRRVANAIDPSMKDSQYKSLWNSNFWLFRALSEEQVPAVLKWLSNISIWSKVLYGETSSFGNKIHKCEIFSLQKLLLALETRSGLLRKLSSDSAYDFTAKYVSLSTLTLPSSFVRDLNEPFKSIIQEHTGESSGNISLPEEKLDGWSILYMASEDIESYGEVAKALDGLDFGNRRSLRFQLARSFKATRLISLPSPAVNIDSDSHDLAHFKVLALSSAVKDRMLALSDYSHHRYVYYSQHKNYEYFRERSAASIHALLWGPPRSVTGSFEEWNALPWDAPGIGLPISIALAMFRNIVEGLGSGVPTTASNKLQAPIPPVWKIADGCKKFLVEGRRRQLDNDVSEIDVSSSSASTPLVEEGEQLSDWSVAPHPAYYLPWALGLLNEGNLKFKIWCHFLTLLVALEGSERILDSFWLNWGPGAVPFEERWDMRNRIHLPTEVWKELTRLQSWFFHDFDWDSDINTAQEFLRRFCGILANSTAGLLDLEDFEWQRIDISLDLARDMEVSRSVRRWSNQNAVGESLRLDSSLPHTMSVRIAQVSAAPSWNCKKGLNQYVENFPYLNRRDIQTIMRQVWASFLVESQQLEDVGGGLTPGQGAGSTTLIIFPELILPASEILGVAKLVAKTNRAALIGMQLRILNNGLGQNWFGSQGYRFVVNEAMLAVPASIGKRSSAPLVRKFFIRKPTPSHCEIGLMQVLSSRNQIYKFQRGRNWYRFLHKDWGDFSIAICSDIVDPRPWASMRGQILHIFMPACNPDVDLFDSMTWVRAYENYVNIVSTNHGMYGGSFAWSPQHNHSKELARLRGPGIYLIADIKLPVSELHKEQIDGVEKAVRFQSDVWGCTAAAKSDDGLKFKAPPPGFRPRKSQDISSYSES